MTDVNQSFDMPPDIKPPLPGGINVLTILTFIGCGIGFIGSIWQFFGAKRNLDRMEEMINSGNYENMPKILKNMMSPEALEVARKTYENRVPVTLIGLVALVLCLVGAIQMRQLKKQGYTLYLLGEVLPFVGTLVFVGFAALAGFGGILALCFTALFIILYTVQRKHLVN